MGTSSSPGQRPVRPLESVVQRDAEPVFEPVFLAGLKRVFPVAPEPFHLPPEAQEPIARLWQLVS